MLKASILAQITEECANYLRLLAGQEIQVTDAVESANRAHDDTLHRMEKEDCLYPERARLATKLGASQRERRAHKDWLYTMKPALRWLATTKGEKLIALLAEFTGILRKVAEREAQP